MDFQIAASRCPCLHPIEETARPGGWCVSLINREKQLPRHSLSLLMSRQGGLAAKGGPDKLVGCRGKTWMMWGFPADSAPLELNTKVGSMPSAPLGAH